MKTIEQQDSAPAFAFTLLLFMTVLAILSLTKTEQMLEPVNQFLGELLAACKLEMRKYYGL